MDSKEFGDWWEDFERRFPSKASWAAQNGSGTIESWFEVLQPVSLDDALAANSRIHKGRADFGRDWDRIPVAIRDVAAACRSDRIAAERRCKQAEGEASQRCQLCDNTGVVIREDGERRSWGYACPCSHGDKYTSKERKVPLKRWRQVERYSELDAFNEPEESGVF